MESVKDEFQGFGEDFTGFPKRLPDDCVNYTLFLVDSKLRSQKEVLARLEAVRKESARLSDLLLRGYIWQRDAFELVVERQKDMIYLQGQSNYGDSVEDEWLIVHMLRELSKRFSDLWIKVVDTDGEFLLIEAANALPRWLNPEIADNRIWINNNELRIIPLIATRTTSSDTKTASISRPLTLDEGLKIISSDPGILIHSPLIEAEAFFRLQNYPAQISASLHHALITIPRKLAFILHSNPSAIAPATEAFYLRDPISLRPLQTASSDLVFPPKDLVTVSTRFTKVLFAQLKSQRFSVPSVWRDILADQNDQDEPNSLIDPVYAQLQLGMKVTTGFEMLLSDTKNKDNRQVRLIQILLEDLAEDEDTDLPTDDEIAKWDDVTREDDEKWLDINFEDFDRELQGKTRDKKSSGNPGAFDSDPPSGFGDAKTQADLQKMVERFQGFLNDEDAGVEGAEMDDMDIDDDDDGSDDSSEDEDKEVSFDEAEFARMMKEMMGMPSEEDIENMATNTSRTSQSEVAGRIKDLESSDEDEEVKNSDENEAAALRKVMDSMEAELKEAGALNLNPGNSSEKMPTLADNTGLMKEDWEDESDDGEEGIDFNLAKNLLESFKSQAGMAGPAGNLMKMMGMQLPRDEGDV